MVSLNPLSWFEDSREPQDINRIISHTHQVNEYEGRMRYKNTASGLFGGAAVGLMGTFLTVTAPWTAGAIFLTGTAGGLGTPFFNGFRKERNAEKAGEYHLLDEDDAESLVDDYLSRDALKMYENRWTDVAASGTTRDDVMDDIEGGEMYFFRHLEDENWFELTVYDGEENSVYGGEMDGADAEPYLSGPTLAEDEETVEEAASYLDGDGIL